MSIKYEIKDTTPSSVELNKTDSVKDTQIDANRIEINNNIDGKQKSKMNLIKDEVIMLSDDIFGMMTNLMIKIIIPMVTYFLTIMHISLSMKKDSVAGSAVFILSPLLVYGVVCYYYIEFESRILLAKLLIKENCQIKFKEVSILGLFKFVVTWLIIIHFIYESIYIYSYEYDSGILTNYLIASLQLLTWLLLVNDYRDINNKTTPINKVSFEKISQIVSEGVIESLGQLLVDIDSSKEPKEIKAKKFKELFSRPINEIEVIKVGYKAYNTYAFSMIMNNEFQEKHPEIKRRAKYINWTLLASLCCAVVIEVYGFSKT
jgi:hypothetical protein